MATNLGAVTPASTDCINPLTPTFTLLMFSSTGVVLTTTNGDQVLAMYSGILSSDCVVTGIYVIHGGTSRAVNGTGSGTARTRQGIA